MRTTTKLHYGIDLSVSTIYRTVCIQVEKTAPQLNWRLVRLEHHPGGTACISAEKKDNSDYFAGDGYRMVSGEIVSYLIGLVFGQAPDAPVTATVEGESEGKDWKKSNET